MENLLLKMSKVELDAEREKQINNTKISEEDRQKRIDLINTISLKTNKMESK